MSCICQSVSPSYVFIGEVRTSEVGIGEFGITSISPNKTSLGQISFSKIGKGKVGCSKIGPSEIGFSEAQLSKKRTGGARYRGNGYRIPHHPALLSAPTAEPSAGFVKPTQGQRLTCLNLNCDTLIAESGWRCPLDA